MLSLQLAFTWLEASAFNSWTLHQLTLLIRWAARPSTSPTNNETSLKKKGFVIPPSLLVFKG